MTPGGGRIQNYEYFRYNFYSVAAVMVASVMADFVVRAIIGADLVIKMRVFPSP